MTAEEATADEILTSLEEGNVVLEPSEGGTPITVRKCEDTYYCDTSVKLYTTQDSTELLDRLAGFGLPVAGKSGGA